MDQASVTGIIACERSGIVRERFRRRGLNFISVDLAPAEDGSPHHEARDVREALIEHGTFLRFFMVHPECTYLCNSGLHWNKRRPGRAAKTEQALAFVEWLFKWALFNPYVKFVLENPAGCINTRLPELARQFAWQAIQPNQFGEDASKETWLWLQGLPPLRPTAFAEPRFVGDAPQADIFGAGGKPRWSNQTDSGQNRLPPSESRWMDRSRTYPKIADAMVQQWAPLLGLELKDAA